MVAEPSCETKPICGVGAPGLRIVDCGLRIERPGANERICETKPICSGQAGGGRPRGITQAVVQNKANWGVGDKGGTPSPRTPYGVTTSASHSTKQSQFESDCGLGIADCGLSPDSLASPTRAKQSQLGGVGACGSGDEVGLSLGGLAPAFCAKQSQFGGCVSLSALWRRDYDRLAILRNKANSRPGALGARIRAGGRRGRPQRQVRACETKPIQGSGIGGRGSGDGLCETKPIRATGSRPPC